MYTVCQSTMMYVGLPRGADHIQGDFGVGEAGGVGALGQPGAERAIGIEHRSRRCRRVHGDRADQQGKEAADLRVGGDEALVKGVTRWAHQHCHGAQDPDDLVAVGP